MTAEYEGIERRKADRRSVVERRTDRRDALDRRRGPGRRRSDTRRSAEEGEMSDDLLEFVLAMDDYKRVNNRPFPTWSEVFEVIRYLGYRKVAEPGEHIDRPIDTTENVVGSAAQTSTVLAEAIGRPNLL